jgi:hypothetical protein
MIRTANEVGEIGRRPIRREELFYEEDSNDKKGFVLSVRNVPYVKLFQRETSNVESSKLLPLYLQQQLF